MDRNNPDLSKMGTPKSLQHAIYRSLCVGPLSNVLERSYQVLVDYISSRFSVFTLKHPECEDVLKELFEDITKREFQERVMTIEEWKKKDKKE